MPRELDAIIQAHGLPHAAAAELRSLWDGRELGEQTTLIAGAEPPEGPPVAPPSSGLRYSFLQKLGHGGFAEVWRVHDAVMDRTVAMKVVHPHILVDPGSMRRFLAEAHATGRLQHPNIVPVYDVGQLDDGRVWFTMREVHGQTLRSWLRAPAPHAPSLVRRITVFLAMCHALAHAHELGVVHRDVKPSNVMIGGAGEVYVLDWGIAKLLGQTLTGSSTSGSMVSDGPHTLQGWVGGTPGYMPPEQARGQVNQVDQRADVFALGAVLYEMLEGRAPYVGEPLAVLRATLDGPPPPLWEGHAPELVAVVEAAMAREPVDRPPDAAALVEPVQAWLEGARRREQALELARRAMDQQRQVVELRKEAARLAREATAAMAGIPSWAPEEQKHAGWDAQERAQAVALDAELADLEVEQGLQAALRLAPDLEQAHALLVQRARAAHEAAEEARDPTATRRLERWLRAHTEALPGGHPARQAAEAYLSGEGAVTLVTDPPGAEAFLYRVVTHRRRKVEAFERGLGPTPLRAVPLPHGSYVILVRAPGRAPVRVPVVVRRLGHWDMVPPGLGASLAIPLPADGELGPDEVYVPAGWFDAGSPDAGVTPRRLWVDGLVVQRFPVTNDDYLAFLDGLVAEGRVGEALRHAPRERSGSPDDPGALLVDFDGARFHLRPDAQGDLWQGDWPVVQVDWHAAMAYADWFARRTGRPWRLPGEFEWEKIARGVDGRIFPWGDEVDPSWAHIAGSRPGRAMLGPVGDFPADVSVYGVRGLGGNVQDWCVDRFDAPLPEDGAIVWPEVGPVDGDPLRMARGGGWDTLRLASRCAARTRAVASYRSWQRGFRLVRSLGLRSR